VCDEDRWGKVAYEAYRKVQYRTGAMVDLLPWEELGEVEHCAWMQAAEVVKYEYHREVKIKLDKFIDRMKA
jgi:hypothetical protein